MLCFISNSYHLDLVLYSPCLQHIINSQCHIAVMAVKYIDIRILGKKSGCCQTCFCPGPVGFFNPHNFNVRITGQIFQKCLCSVNLGICSLRTFDDSHFSFFSIKTFHHQLTCQISLFRHTCPYISCNIFRRYSIHFHIQIDHRDSGVLCLAKYIQIGFRINRTKNDGINFSPDKIPHLLFLFFYIPFCILDFQLIIRIFLCFCNKKISNSILITGLTGCKSGTDYFFLCFLLRFYTGCLRSDFCFIMNSYCRYYHQNCRRKNQEPFFHMLLIHILPPSLYGRT